MDVLEVLNARLSDCHDGNNGEGTFHLPVTNYYGIRHVARAKTRNKEGKEVEVLYFLEYEKGKGWIKNTIALELFPEPVLRLKPKEAHRGIGSGAAGVEFTPEEVLFYCKWVDAT